MEGPFLAFFRPLTANAVRSRVGLLSPDLLLKQYISARQRDPACCKLIQRDIGRPGVTALLAPLHHQTLQWGSDRWLTAGMAETQVPPHSPFLRLKRLQGITQIINSQDGSVQNLAEFRVANAVNGALNVAGTVDPVRNSDGEAVRVDVKFTSFSLKLGALPQLKIPLTWPKTPLVSFFCYFCCSSGQFPKPAWIQALESLVPFV